MRNKDDAETKWHIMKTKKIKVEQDNNRKKSKEFQKKVTTEKEKSQDTSWTRTRHISKSGANSEQGTQQIRS
ncbi:hypothetical protein HYE10_03840 [Mycoplasmopsis bovis]|nr:hypothetical protein HYE10_03840 [Mycoplasmopsis bovis]